MLFSRERSFLTEHCSQFLKVKIYKKGSQLKFMNETISGIAPVLKTNSIRIYPNPCFAKFPCFNTGNDGGYAENLQRIRSDSYSKNIYTTFSNAEITPDKKLSAGLL